MSCIYHPKSQCIMTICDNHIPSQTLTQYDIIICDISSQTLTQYVITICDIPSQTQNDLSSQTQNDIPSQT